MTAGMGRHLLIEMYECDPDILNDVAAIEKAMLCAARCCGTTIIHHFFHRFSVQGVSGIIVIAESHMSVHTWPELGYAAIDLFTCSRKTLPDACLDSLRNALGCARVSQQIIIRGEALAVESR
jgi:S-adenosylmethionine decarboxylase proenzyme